MGAGTIGGGGIGMLLIVLAVSCLTGTNPLALLDMVEQARPAANTVGPDRRAERTIRRPSSLRSCWPTPKKPGRASSSGGQRYRAPVLVLFEDAVQSACGSASAASGPFYCPADQKVYLDLVVLPRARSAVRRARRLRAGLRRRARSRPSRAEPARHQSTSAGRRSRPAAAGPARTRCRCSSNCRRIASPACGAITPARSSCSTRATSKRALRAAAAIGDDRLTQGPRVARELHARHVGAARALAAPGPVRAATSTPAIRSAPGLLS